MYILLSSYWDMHFPALSCDWLLLNALKISKWNFFLQFIDIPGGSKRIIACITCFFVTMKNKTRKLMFKSKGPNLDPFSIPDSLKYFRFSPNTGKYGPEITPYLDTFHAVLYFSMSYKHVLICFLSDFVLLTIS